MAPRRARRCLVIGTSNTVRRGGFPSYMRSLAPDLDLVVDGVGATPSVLLPYVLAEVPLEGVTHVVVDCFVNDSGHIARQGGEAAVCEAILFDAIAWLRGQGIQVILLLLPRANAGSATDAARARRLAFCRAQGIPVVDGVALVETLGRSQGLGPAELFDDPQHVAWPVALMVAQRLVALVADTAQAEPRAPRPRPYLRRPLPPPPGALAVERSTSLVPTKRYLRLEIGQASVIELEEEATLLGVSLNGALGGGLLEVTAEGGTTREARHVEADSCAPGREMIHLVHPFAAPLRGRRFRFALAAESATDAFMEVEAAVFRRGALPMPEEPARLPAEGEALLLAPLEVALAQAALATRKAGAATGGEGQVERQFRRLLAGDPPAWARHPAHVARFLAQLGVALGDDRAARRLLQQAAEAYPEAEELRADLARLVRRMQGG